MLKALTSEANLASSPMMTSTSSRGELGWGNETERERERETAERGREGRKREGRETVCVGEYTS